MNAGAAMIMTGAASWAPHDVPQRRLDPGQIGEARRRRAMGQGWQTIANVLRVNILDLRKAYEDAPAIGEAPAAPSREPPAPKATLDEQRYGATAKGLASARRLKLLAAIKAGFATPGEAAQSLGFPSMPAVIYADFTHLRRTGLIAGNCQQGGRARVTTLGLRQLGGGGHG
jgi:hypothetical protein